MTRKQKYSNEVKLKACEDYENGYGRFDDIANEIGAGRSVVRRWYHTYKVHGTKAFVRSNKQRSYSREFKLLVVKEYNSGNYYMLDLAAKYNVAENTIRYWINQCYNGIEFKDANCKLK